MAMPNRTNEYGIAISVIGRSEPFLSSAARSEANSARWSQNAARAKSPIDSLAKSEVRMREQAINLDTTLTRGETRGAVPGEGGKTDWNRK